MPEQKHRWQDLCEQATEEQDSSLLRSLIDEILKETDPSTRLALSHEKSISQRTETFGVVSVANHFRFKAIEVLSH